MKKDTDWYEITNNMVVYNNDYASRNCIVKSLSLHPEII